MSAIQQLLTDHIGIWTGADAAKRSGRGRSSSNASNVYGVKKMRELILELAVRGKLVPQDANDEPASALLKRIQVEKEKLVKVGKIKKEKPLPEIMEEEKSFELPAGWEWVRLGSQVLESGAGWSPSCEGRPRSGNEWGVLKVSAVSWGRFQPEENKALPSNLEPRLDCLVKVGDFLVSRANTAELVARSVVVDELQENLLLSDKIVRLRLTEFCYSKYINAVNGCWDSRSYYARVAGGTSSSMKNVSREQILNLVLALPPLAEQRRIVAKVDELMALCDQLENEHNNAAEAHEKIVSVLLQALIQSADAAAFADGWQRIAAHFNTLFTTEASIDALKQTLLQLAVMGKLVPQDANDEPASELLKRIRAEKDKLIKAGKIKKDKPLAAITEEEQWFQMPENWSWIKLDFLSLSSEAGWSPQCFETQRIKNKWGVLKVSAVTWGRYNPDANKGLPDHLEPRPEYEVKPGDFLISRANTAELVAKAVVVPSDAPNKLMMSDKIIRFVFTKSVYGEFINLVNSSNYARAYYARVAGGTSSSMKNVSREQIGNLVFALPPLAEQNRIVAKIDELIALCDQLKSRIAEASEVQRRLADGIAEI